MIYPLTRSILLETVMLCRLLARSCMLGSGYLPFRSSDGVEMAVVALGLPCGIVYNVQVLQPSFMPTCLNGDMYSACLYLCVPCVQNKAAVYLQPSC